jgi:hypothetical protein
MLIGSKLLSPPAPVGLHGVVAVRRDGCADTQRGTDMTKTKGRASAKPRSGAKSRSKAKKPKRDVHSNTAGPSRR